jgi:mannitol 2-dehydrogenase
MTEVYGDLRLDKAVADRFAAMLRAVWAEGTETVMRRYIDGGR